MTVTSKNGVRTVRLYDRERRILCEAVSVLGELAYLNNDEDAKEASVLARKALANVDGTKETVAA